MSRVAQERGQVTVLTAVFMIGVLGLAGFVIDVGSWFHQQRVTQATVDAAALAGAQSLPNDPSGAVSTATSFAQKNGGVAGATFTVGSRWNPDDEITVDQRTPASGFFSKLFGVSVISVHATATAVAEVPSEVQYAAPIVVNIDHPDLSGPGCPCFDVPTTIPLGKNGAPGSFALVNLISGDTTGTVGASTLANWIESGFDQYLPLGVYFSDSGAKFNDNAIQSSLQLRYGSDLLFPVYDTLIGTGSNAQYHVVGWASFHLTLAQSSGSSGSLSGYFTSVIWKGVVNANGNSNPPIPNLGVYSVALVN